MSRLLIRVLALSFLATLCLQFPNSNIRTASAAPPGGYVLDWSDEFTGTAVDPNHWKVDTFWKNPTQFATNAVRVSGGQLIITTYTSGGKHYSGSVSTMDRYEPLYGYVEASIKFDNSLGMFSTFWQWSHNMAAPPYDNPHGLGTEMDIAEHSLVIGNPSSGYTDTHSQASTTLHWDGYPGTPSPHPRTAGGDLHSGVGDLSSGFHTYGHEWSPDVERFYYDGILVWTVNDSPGDPSPPLTPVSHTNEFIYLSSEVGLPPCWCGPIPAQGYGTLAPEGTASLFAPLIVPSPSVTKMYVDYVRHYREILPPNNVADLCVGSTTNSTITLTWTAPGDNYGTCAEYDLRRSTSPINDYNFSQAIRVNVPPPHSPGSAESFEVISLLACTTHYFALKTRDVSGNWSGISNVLSARTAWTQCGTISPAGRAEQVPIPCGAAAAKGPVVLDEGSPSFSAPSPNPARGTTSFLISVPAGFQGAKLRVDVFDVAGRRVRSLVDRIASQGPAAVEWNLMNDSGRRVASGLYRVRVSIGDTRKIFPLVVLR